MAGKPFVFLGVNSDKDPQMLKTVKQDEGLKWRDWWDGGIDGPIQKQWNVIQRPTVYLLDAKGLIRAKDLLGEDLDAAVDALVEELTSAE